ncbi:LiaF transmembrane domain-containing protein [Dictyoglomus turgidum]|uniref:LiaF transmembrane domain-containing protein n=1 Tax=Dictyoglomus turgidum TaxID=513050 RepID=UPI000CCDBA85|nr:DUF5668 domain-containing protein [Dictyoglomus turgidum]PNV79228.1 MAG: hypothetical protein C0196_06475 [Dictyoglomus turgidum]
MKRRISLLGIFLILSGLLLLLSELRVIHFYWKDLLMLWPLIFIFWGLDLLIGEKRWGSWVTILIIFLLVFFIVFLSTYGRPFFRGRGHDFYYKEWRYPFKENVKVLNLDISTGIRSVILEGVKNKEDLIYIKSNSDFYINKIKEEEQNGELSLSLKIENEELEFGFFYMSNADQINLNISSDIFLNLNFERGVGNAVLNMKNFKLRNLSVKGGVGNLKVYLPKFSCYVEVEGGVGSIEVYIPENVILDLSTEAGIGRISVDKNIEQGKGGEKEIIHLRVRSGIGNIKILSEKKEVI